MGKVYVRAQEKRDCPPEVFILGRLETKVLYYFIFILRSFKEYKSFYERNKLFQALYWLLLVQSF